VFSTPASSAGSLQIAYSLRMRTTRDSRGLPRDKPRFVEGVLFRPSPLPAEHFTVSKRVDKCPKHGQGRFKSMPLIQILLALIVVGVLLWLVNRFIPMAGSIKSILNAVVVICVVLWLLNVFGLFHSLSQIHVGSLRH